MKYIEPNSGEIFDSVVIVDGVEVSLAERFHPDFVAELVPYDPANAPAAPQPTLDMLQVQLVQAATAKRWEVETSGITLPDGVRVATDKADQDRITAVVVNAAAAGVETLDFKAVHGWVTLTVAEVQGVASAIALHVQACFSAERAHHVAIAALTTAEAAQVYDLSAGWPT